MELRIHYTKLPEDMDLELMKAELAEVLDDEGWLTGSAQAEAGGWLEMELEDERANPKYGIIAVKNYLQSRKFAVDTTIELAGTPVGIYE